MDRITKIKLIVADLDGTIVDSRSLHYEALNRALESVDVKYKISLEDHLSRYDGRPTSVKLDMLTKEKGLPKELHSAVWQRKQSMTFDIIREKVGKDERICNILRELKSRGYILYCASNSIWKTMALMLQQKGFLDHFDYFLSNEDVLLPKPNPQMYMQSIMRAGVSPRETLILEDSDIGRTAALLSGAHLCPIENPSDLTLEKILCHIEMAEVQNEKNEPEVRANNKNLTIVVPMSGLGSRFANVGYSMPKPLIEVRLYSCQTDNQVKGKPMIQVVLENLNINAKYVFIVQRSHYEKYNLQYHFLKVCTDLVRYLLRLISPDCEIVITEGLTEGAACSVLLAKEFINNDNPILMANSDQFIVWNSSAFLYQAQSLGVDGTILTFDSVHPKWSFAKLGQDGFVTEVAEKKPISNHATVGIYYWSKGSDFVKYAEQMIAKDIRVNNEFYVCPVYNEAIQDDKKIKIVECAEMWGIGRVSSVFY